MAETSGDYSQIEVDETDSEKAVGKQKKKWHIQKLIIENLRIFLKIQEILICALCLGFSHEPMERTRLVLFHPLHVCIMYMAYGGFLFICTLLLIGHLMGERIPCKTYAIFSIVGAASFKLAAILLTIDRNYLKQDVYQQQFYLISRLTATITLSFINAFTFALDAIFSLVRLSDF